MSELTTEFGAPVVDDNNIQTAGPRGPALLQDVWFLEKLARVDREVISERHMHANPSSKDATGSCWYRFILSTPLPRMRRPATKLSKH